MAVWPSATDVAIIGGGPAGTAAALTLRRYTQRDCVILEATDFSPLRVGESVSPALLPLLDFLGAPAPSVPTEMIPSFGSEASWGSAVLAQRASLSGSTGPGWSLNRRGFDAALADAAEAAECSLLRGAVVRRLAAAPDGGWVLTIDHAEKSHTLIARQLIDASGRSCAAARKLGAKRHIADRLVGIAALIACPAGRAVSHTVLVEALPSGWWYAAPLPGDRAILCFMTDADLIRADGLSLEAYFAQHLAQSVHVRRRFADADLITQPRTYQAHTQHLAPCTGSFWVAAGDAATSHDPLASIGIGHALTSGIQAARVVHARLDEDDTLAPTYARDISGNYTAYAERLAALYAAEQRWPDEPFWRRRHSPIHSALAFVPPDHAPGRRQSAYT